MDRRPLIANNGLRLIYELLGLDAAAPSDSPTPQDAVLIAVDFENLENVRKIDSPGSDLNSQVGLAILDTKALISSKPRKKVISTYNFAAGPSKYCARASRRFLFKNSITVTRNEMLRSIEALVPRSRSIIFVGHDIKQDLRALQDLNFDLQTSVLGIVDTQRIAREVLPATSGALGDILTFFDCPFDKLHCAGNDAHFTLRILLLLAVYAQREDEQLENRLALLREIAYYPIPYRMDPHVKGARKQMERELRSRKYQSKFWDFETQERIRAERAERRHEAEAETRSQETLVEEWSLVERSLERSLVEWFEAYIILLMISTFRIAQGFGAKAKRDGLQWCYLWKAYLNRMGTVGALEGSDPTPGELFL